MLTLHASAVAFDGRAALLTGASGSGKSSLALELIALGGVLVADDQVEINVREEGVWLSAPQPLAGRIEARGIGVLTAPHETAPHPLHLILDLDQTETDRIPPRRTRSLSGVSLPLLFRANASPPAALILALQSGVADPEGFL